MFTRTEQVFSPNFLNIARTSIFETGFTVSFLHSRALFSGLRIRVQWKNDMHDGKNPKGGVSVYYFSQFFLKTARK